MKKLAKHRLILGRRVNQATQLKKISKIENETLQDFLFAFQAVKKSRYDKDDLNAFSRSESYRNALLKDVREISYEVFSLEKTMLVKDICRIAASRNKWCRFLYLLVKRTNKPKILEIGTNLGVSGTYMLEAMRGKGGKFITMEGLPQLCEIASEQFLKVVPKSSFEVLQGLYDETFPRILQKELHYNLLFIDGNHKKEPTLEYFKSLKNKLEKAAVLVFDDIYWSNGMKEAWEIVKNDSDVNFSIDMYEQGIIIIDKDESLKNHHFELHLSY